MTSSLQVLKHAVVSNEYDFLLAHEYLTEALDILQKSPSYKRPPAMPGPLVSCLFHKPRMSLGNQIAPRSPFTLRAGPSTSSATGLAASPQKTELVVQGDHSPMAQQHGASSQMLVDLFVRLGRGGYLNIPTTLQEIPRVRLA